VRNIGVLLLNTSLTSEGRIMETHVEFRSNRFPPYDGEEEQINPGLYGKRLAGFFDAA
jgi:hypothetical protein